MGEAGGEEAMPNPGELFGQLFGGKAFEDWIGEISLGKVSTNDSPPSQTPRERELNLSFHFTISFRKFRKLSLVLFSFFHLLFMNLSRLRRRILIVCFDYENFRNKQKKKKRNNKKKKLEK